MATSNLKDRGATVIDFAAPLPPALYWDATFIVNSISDRGTWHRECAEFMTRLENSDTISCVSTLALDEAWFVLLQKMIEADYPDSKFWNVVNQNRAMVSRYVERLEEITNKIYSSPRARVIAINTDAPRQALGHMRDFYLLPRDALHLAAMRQHKIAHIVTTDADFLPVPDISIFTCNPALLSR